MALLSLKNVCLSYGGLPLLDEVEFHIERGDRVCLLGVNGTGKSSMLRVLAGEINPDCGQVIRASNVRVTCLPQQVPATLEGLVLDIVCPGAARNPTERNTQDARQILSRLQLDASAEFAALSGGMRRRVLLARALLGQPDIVLLDEPTNHLDVDSITWLEAFLLRYCRTFLFVTHDRSFLRRLAARVVELDRGRLSDWSCDYDTFLRRKEESLQAEDRQWERLDDRLKKEEAWKRQGVKARTVRNQGRLRALEALRVERRERRERMGSVQMRIQEAERTGQVVLKAANVTFGFGNRPLIRDFSTIIRRGDKVGIIGPNGCGKTTLLRLLLQSADESGLMPLAGHMVHGTNLQIAYSDQLRAQLDEKQSLADNIAQGQEFVMIQGVRRHVFGYLQDFLFAADSVRQPVSSLSGGERNRLLLARLFAQPSNMLVLDEPTNDLDLATLELLEEQLSTYGGTVLLVSHDRAFLDNVVTSVLVFEKQSCERPGEWLGPEDGWYVNEYVGGYEDWAKRRVLPPSPVAAPVSEPAPLKAVPRREQPGSKKRLSSWEERELEELEKRIEALEMEQAQLHATLVDPAFYRKNDEGVLMRASQRSEELVIEIEKACDRWAVLASRRTDECNR